METLAIIIAFVLAIMIAICVHEWAHAYAALKQGDPTAKMAGRVTLNPRKHLEPMGILMFLIVGIGWAKPVPVNPFNYKNFKRGNFWVSIAGVLTNLIMGFVASLAFFLLVRIQDPHFMVWAITWFFSFMMTINIALMIFNLLPIPPLDGYNLLKSFTKPNNKVMQFLRDNQMLLLMTILIISIIPQIPFGIFTLAEFIYIGFLRLWGVIF